MPAGVDDLADLRVHVAGGPHREGAAPGEPAHPGVARAVEQRGASEEALHGAPDLGLEVAGQVGLARACAQSASAARAPRRSSGR